MTLDTDVELVILLGSVLSLSCPLSKPFSFTCPEFYQRTQKLLVCGGGEQLEPERLTKGIIELWVEWKSHPIAGYQQSSVSPQGNRISCSVPGGYFQDHDLQETLAFTAF